MAQGIPVVESPHGIAVSISQNGIGIPVSFATNGYGLAVTVVASGGAMSVVPEGPSIVLSAVNVLESASVNTLVGLFSVVAGEGTYTFTLTNTAGGKFTVAGTNGTELRTAAALDYETAPNHAISVEADNGVDPVLTATYVITVTNVMHTNTVAPAVTGTAVEGETLSCTTGTWTEHAANTYTYQWYHSPSTAITGATASTYELQASDVGQQILCKVTATNAGGAVVANSNTTSTVTEAPEIPNAPILTWVSPDTDDTPEFEIAIDNTIAEGDNLQFEYQLAGGDWSSPIDTIDHEITNAEDLANEIDLALSSLADDDYEARCRVSTAAAPTVWSDWSNEEPFTIDAVAGGPTFPTLPGLVGRWNALAANVTLSGSNVTSVAELSGSGANPLTPQGGNVPWSATGWTGGGVGSKPAFGFLNANAALLKATGVPMGTDDAGYCFFVGQMLSGCASFGGAVVFGQGSTNDYDGAGNAAFFTRSSGSPALDSTSAIYSPPSAIATALGVNYRVGINMFGAGAGGNDFYLNNVLQTNTGSVGSFGGTGTIVVGGRFIAGNPAPTSQPWEGAICEIVVGTGALSLAELNALDDYFRAQWGPSVIAWDTLTFGPNFTFSNADLDASKTAGGWSSVRANIGKNSGKLYFEEKIQATADYAYVGVIDGNATLFSHMVDVGGRNAFGKDLRGGNPLEVSGSFSLTASTLSPTIAAGDVVGIAVDFPAGKIYMSINNNFAAFKVGSNPATDTNHVATFTPNAMLFPGASAYGGGGTVTIRLAAAGTYTYSPPSGFSSWS